MERRRGRKTEKNDSVGEGKGEGKIRGRKGGKNTGEEREGIGKEKYDRLNQYKHVFYHPRIKILTPPPSQFFPCLHAPYLLTSVIRMTPLHPLTSHFLLLYHFYIIFKLNYNFYDLTNENFKSWEKTSKFS